MRVDIKKPDVKKLVSIIAAILIILLLSNLSLAGVTDAIKDELEEHDVLSSSVTKETDNSKSVAPSPACKSESSSDSSENKNSDPKPESLSSESKIEPVKTDLYSQLKRYTECYNSGIDEVPDVVKKVAGNDVILLDIAMLDNTDMQIKVRTKDGMIVEFRQLSSDEHIDPTVTVRGDEGTIYAILKSEDPLGYFLNSLNQGSLDVECKGFLKKAALSALKAMA